MAENNWEDFVDGILEANFEYDDLKRVMDDVADNENGIDNNDSERLLVDFCATRYRFAFVQMAVNAIYYVTKPKTDYKSGARHIRKAISLLMSMHDAMKSMHQEIERDEEDEKKD
jgi:hypothetical protein